MCPYDAMSMDGIRYNLTNCLWYGPFDPSVDQGFIGEAVQGTEGIQALGYEELMSREEKDSFADLRDLPSPKWRAWFKDTWSDRLAIHETLDRCGVAVTGQLGVDLVEAGYALDVDVTGMTIEELVSRIDARHRFLASAFRAARDGVYRDEPSAEGAGLSPRRSTNRPATYAAVMETVGRLKGENMRWKEIREEVLRIHRYRSDSEDALRKQFERWQKRCEPPG